MAIQVLEMERSWEFGKHPVGSRYRSSYTGAALVYRKALKYLWGGERETERANLMQMDAANKEFLDPDLVLYTLSRLWITGVDGKLSSENSMYLRQMKSVHQAFLECEFIDSNLVIHLYLVNLLPGQTTGPRPVSSTFC